ncbi:hypothetical protein FACS189432_06400 [Bacteroidia bacterium]|nr:hypothetical protein FACS189432_06400 [Bacteroidia bacterium]
MDFFINLVKTYKDERKYSNYKRQKRYKFCNKLTILKSMQNKKVLVFLAKAFETMEFCVFIDVLGWARVDYGHNLE